MVDASSQHDWLRKRFEAVDTISSPDITFVAYEEVAELTEKQWQTAVKILHRTAAARRSC